MACQWNDVKYMTVNDIAVNDMAVDDKTCQWNGLSMIWPVNDMTSIIWLSMILLLMIRLVDDMACQWYDVDYMAVDYMSVDNMAVDDENLHCHGYFEIKFWEIEIRLTLDKFKFKRKTHKTEWQF